MAVLPLLIKGIEVVYHDRNHKASEIHAATTNWHGSLHDLVRRLSKHYCRIKSGPLMVSIAVWMMRTSSLVEYLFSRRDRALYPIQQDRDSDQPMLTPQHSDNVPVSVS